MKPCSTRVPQLETRTSGLITIAVTGTNGKTSATHMIAEIVRAAGEVPVRVTTLGMWVGDEQVADDGSLASFERTLGRARDAGARTLALEVTSRALAAGFAKRWPAHVAAFTNLTHDHMDRHGSPERYLAAKAQLFIRLRAGGTAVVNAADRASELLQEVLPAGTRCLGYLGKPGERPVPCIPVSLAAREVACSTEGTRATLASNTLARCLGGELVLRALGAFQVENALCAALAAHAAGFEPETIRAGILAFAGVPGRFQPCSREPLVVIDYAHTPDALARVLETARALATQRGGRLGCVFGCGGERDRDKRPRMGEIADRASDAVWLTTDNPRGESARDIAAMVQRGVRGHARFRQEPDRRRAIESAIAWARPTDVVVVAGRGHETHQRWSDGEIPFSDYEVAIAAMGRRAR